MERPPMTRCRLLVGMHRLKELDQTLLLITACISFVYFPYSFGTTWTSKKNCFTFEIDLFVCFLLDGWNWKFWYPHSGGSCPALLNFLPPRCLGPRTSKQPLRSAFQFCLEHELVDWMTAGMSDKCEEKFLLNCWDCWDNLPILKAIVVSQHSELGSLTKKNEVSFAKGPKIIQITFIKLISPFRLFQAEMCWKAGHHSPLHRCDLPYSSTKNWMGVRQAGIKSSVETRAPRILRMSSCITALFGRKVGFHFANQTTTLNFNYDND